MAINKALIVEDNDRFRELITFVLRSLGAKDIVEARDGREAIDMLQTFDADVAIMDWKMAGMDGMECSRHIRSGTRHRHATVPIVMVSGYGGDDAIRHAQGAGVDVYLNKPISMKHLHKGISSAVNARRACGTQIAML